mgnify:CR=1 FL=1
MSRYRVRAATPVRLWVQDTPDTYEPTPTPTLTVYSEARDTGLVDDEGNAILSVPDQIGFIRTE